MNLLNLQDAIRKKLQSETYQTMHKIALATGLPFATIKRYRTGAVEGQRFYTVAMLAAYYGFTVVEKGKL